MTGSSKSRANVVRRPRSVAEKVAIGAAGAAGLRPALDGDHVVGRDSSAHQATTTIAVTSAFSVASGRSTFQPKLMSWS